MSTSTPSSIDKKDEPVVVNPIKKNNDVSKDDNSKCKKCCNCFNNFKEKCVCSTRNCFNKLVTVGNNFLISLQNPVVAVNALLAATSVTSLLIGYIKYEKRFFADKSNTFIISSVVGITGLLTADCFFSNKYYKKFDKSG